MAGGLAIGAASLLVARIAHADDEAADGAGATGFVWEAPPECPSRALAERAVRDRVVNGALPPARVRVTALSSGYRVRILLDALERSERRERVLDVARCEDAADATAVIVALAVDAPASTSTAEKREGARGVPDAVPPSSRPPAREGLGVDAVLLGALDVGSLPSASPGIVGAVGVHGRAMRAELQVGAYVPTARVVARQDATPAEASAGLFDVMGQGCLVGSLAASLDAGACLGVGVGVLYARVRGIDAPRDDAAARFQGATTVRLGVPIAGRWSARLDVGALFDPATRGFVVRGLGEVHRPSPVALRAGIGIAVIFW